MIYFVLDRAGNAVKIGYTRDTDSLISRIGDLQVGNPRRLELLFTIPGGRAGEKFLHKMLRSSRLCGEWFECTTEVVDIIYKIKEGAEEFDPDNDLIA